MTEVNGVTLLERKMDIEISSLTITLTETLAIIIQTVVLEKIFLRLPIARSGLIFLQYWKETLPFVLLLLTE